MIALFMSAGSPTLGHEIAKAFASGIIYTRDDFLQLVHHYSFDELALIAVSYGNEALRVLQDAKRANERVLELVGAIHDHLAEDDRREFAACLKFAVAGCEQQDDAILA